ncbi:p21-activated protein kinase-interacting protein 1-like isoform X2 [Diorhabda sublineata]|uniref:p21-activated protein kinase-interacting protein 1-like isoform X1 n=1 Tax=Diorhabda sublineata TaxID=1163346 RepID=UPI0024E1440E|nr:p21-activated protein kinase-interacting protein 1-like isoform X1 [Diorhabda sublineata]XP_056642207.1 p21-activated protein kinase-interacting protein 1-like isoform X2 [Diorhabda sublineata]
MKTFEIVIGTYEEFLVGYDFFDEQARLVQNFASHDHTASLRTLATCDHYVASGGADDRIIIYDFRLRKEHCMLSHHNSTINCLEFTPNHSHIISGSQDGVLAITRVGNWQVEKIWDKAHKGSATIDIAVHPTGKLALTLGEDCTLRTWNLVKGRQAYAINLRSKSKDAKSLSKICWSVDGVRFIIFGGKYTEIWSIETGGILQVIEHEVKVTSCIWYTTKKILIGYEDGNVCLVKLSTLKKTLHKVHEHRIKALAKYNDWIISGSSSGEIKVYNKAFEEVCKVNSGCRITSMVIIEPIQIKKENSEDIVAIEADELQESNSPKYSTKKRKLQIKNRSEEKSEKITEVNVPTKKKKKLKLIKDS